MFKAKQVHSGQYKPYGDSYDVWEVKTDRSKEETLDWCFKNLHKRRVPEKAEFFLPLAVEQLLSEGKARVKVLSSPDKWYGVTYAADKPQVVAALQEKTQQGLYPDGLWG